ncbi:MAG: 3-carboxymuconate cyclase-like protein, partial [Ramlibacter sp.]|nr:3-carboxymuconate cyclase-like protein [Ramlibacter sp.]
AVDGGSGALSHVGAGLSLPNRPIHLSIDPAGEHALVTFNAGAIRVYRLDAGGVPVAEIIQQEMIQAGNYPHQALVTADGRRVLSTALGQNPGPGHAEDPGAINVFDFERGQLRRQSVVAPDRGYGFGPRHLDLHPNGRWVYVSLERQNRMELFELGPDGLGPRAASSRPLLSRPQPSEVKQHGGAVHVHPNGRFVYGVNRAWQTVEHAGGAVFAGGENTLAVYAIDPATGALETLQYTDTAGIHCRTFAIDPTGTILVAAHIMGLAVLAGNVVRQVPAGLSVFRIADDGSLRFERFHPLDTARGSLFWMGIPTFHTGPTP